MRIIAGEARGRRLFAPAGDETRPTSDRVRESLFSILGGRVAGAHVLDLFAGSGAMALEAISRGAASAVLCDSDRFAADVIARNIALVKAESRARLIRSDWRAALERLRGHRFSLIFIDPPYRMAQVYLQAAQALYDGQLLAQDAVIVMEHAADSPIALPGGFCTYDERRYGDTAIALVRRDPDDRSLSGQL
jgi:16S rRNA (guanine966-N2)-methyltransferase